MKHKAAAIEQQETRNWRGRLRSFFIGLLIFIFCLGFGVYVLVHWVERQILNTDSWVALVSPLPKQPVVSTALGNFVSDKVFTALPVQEKIADALPPKAVFLAGPLTAQLKTLTTNASQKLVASDGFGTVWTGANRIAMNRLLSTSRGQTPELQQRVNEKFDINISDIRGQLRTKLGNSSEAIPALQPAVQKAIDVSADLRTKPQRIHQFVRTTDKLAVILPFVIMAGFLGALALSKSRRRTAITFSVSIIFLMLLELIVLKWARQETLNQVQNAGNLTAIGFIYDTLVNWLRHMIYIVIAGAGILYGILLAAGPSKWAHSVRAYLHIDRLQNHSLSINTSKVRKWVKKRELYTWLAAPFMVLALVALFATVSSQVILNALLLSISLVALLHIIATPHQPDKPYVK
jgi:hypothetical protein